MRNGPQQKPKRPNAKKTNPTANPYNLNYQKLQNNPVESMTKF